MPVILEQISQPAPEDINDLIKIYQDYPPNTPNQPDEPLPDWINSKLSNGSLLFAGRFNGRLIGALWAKNRPDQWQLEQLCVRALTRRRGVARQMLTLLSKQASTQKKQLTISDQQTTAEIVGLLDEIGFQQYDHPEQGPTRQLETPYL